MRTELDPGSRTHHASSFRNCEEEVGSKPSSKLVGIFTGSNNGSSHNLVDSGIPKKVTSEQFDGFRLYHVLAALQSRDIQEDRLQIVEDLDSICSADHLFVSQPRHRIKSTDSEVFFMTERVIQWLGDLLMMSNKASDTAVARAACKIIESMTFSNLARNQEATKKLFSSDLVETVLRAGLHCGVHTECFNILTNCISAHSNDVSKDSIRECIDSLCSLGKSHSKSHSHISSTILLETCFYSILRHSVLYGARGF
jgi:hypothetical protein